METTIINMKERIIQLEKECVELREENIRLLKIIKDNNYKKEEMNKPKVYENLMKKDKIEYSKPTGRVGTFEDFY